MRTDPSISPHGILGRALGSGPLGGLRRYLRWFNLTVLQQALWPLLIAVASAPQVDLDDTPFGWFLLRLAGPALAVLVALAYLRTSSAFSNHVILSEAKDLPPQRTQPAARLELDSRSLDSPSGRSAPEPHFLDVIRALVSPPANQSAPAIATQVRYALLALPVVVGVLRLIAGPFDDAARIILFGLVNVAAYHLIHFGVVPERFDDRRQGLVAGAALFGLSWGLHNALMFGLSDGGWLPGLAAGCFLGWVFGFGTLALQRWPGGWLTGAAVQMLVVYLIAGFV